MTLLTRAIELARQNPIKGLPRVAALLVTKNGDEYVGFNSYKTHPLAKRFGRNNQSICLHAEVDAIRKWLRNEGRESGGTMYVARVLKNGEPALARPCEGCERALVAFGIEEVEWTE